MSIEEEALKYHQEGRPGKLEVISSKPCATEKSLALAYSPGVAAPCMEIFKEDLKVYDYTGKGNLVAVISNGTAVLGLGDIGPLAAKPVMEGKAVLFKQFAGIDVFDLELKTKGVEEFIQAVKALEPTFGGINLEDIKAPECFEIENRLKAEMEIPVFHDDQHGTAIISGAALLNACLVTGRDLSQIQVVFNGAGASANSCAEIFVSLGVPRENIVMCDSQGVIFKGRAKGMNPYKEKFATQKGVRSLGEALVGADVFVGLSVAGALTGEMLKGMNDNPIVFAMANPDPEILPEVAKSVRPDVIIATGRSDYPNQVNNVLGFPSIFRGALDTRAKQINEEMKLAAVYALAELAREDVPEKVSEAYGGRSFQFGRDYLIPKPFDTRVLLRVAPKVARAAMDSGVARKQIDDWQAYSSKLEAIQGPSKVFIRQAVNQVKEKAALGVGGGSLPKIVFPEGTSGKILKALAVILEEKVCEPILLGYPDKIKERMDELGLSGQLAGVRVIQPSKHEQFDAYLAELYEARQRKGLTLRETERLLSSPEYFGAMMLKRGEVDGLVTGASQDFPTAVRPILQIIGTNPGMAAFGLNIVLLKDRFLLLADTTVNINPSAEEIAQMSMFCARVSEFFGVPPKVALLSYSNFGSGQGETPRKMQKALALLRERAPDLKVDGEMQADTAVNGDIASRIFPFCKIKDGANILIFPNLEASNIAYKLLQQVGQVEVIGPMLMGVKQAANVLQRTTTVDSIVHSVVLTALEAQVLKEHRAKALPR